MIMEYRPCVVAVFTNNAGQFLVGERSDVVGAWQFPQGGIDPGESAIAALYREMREELGNDEFEILKQGAREVKYRFPDNMIGKTSISKKYCGQSQQWFLVRYKAEKKPDLSKAEGEFRDWGWRQPKDILEGIVEWKRPAYEEGLKLLGVNVP